MKLGNYPPTCGNFPHFLKEFKNIHLYLHIVAGWYMDCYVLAGIMLKEQCDSLRIK